MITINTKAFDSVLHVTCIHCNGKHVIFVKYADYLQWIYRKKMIQDVLYYLSDGERELLLSKTCATCFNNLFPPIDSDE